MDDEDWDADITSNTVQAYKPPHPAVANHHSETSRFTFGRGRNFEKTESSQYDSRNRNDSPGSRDQGNSRFSRQENYTGGGNSFSTSSNNRNYSENKSGFSSSGNRDNTFGSSNSSDKYNGSGGGSYDNNNNRNEYNLTEMFNIETRLVAFFVNFI